MSLPAVNMPPEPIKRCATTSGEASPVISASVMAAYMGGVSAFFFSGRAKRIVCTPSATEISTPTDIRFAPSRRKLVGTDLENRLGALRDASGQPGCRRRQAFREEPGQRHRHGVRG